MMRISIENLSELKIAVDKHRPFPLAVIENLEKWFEVELTYTSNAIEGNTLTRSETALVIEKGITVGGKPLKDHLEAINHKAAMIAVRTLLQKPEISLEDILSLHKLILKGIDDSNAGCLRNIPVRISGSMVVLPNPVKVPDLVEDFIEWLKSDREHPVLKAAVAHYKLVSIHPFVDGNGRTGRLLMNLILMKHGYPPAIISPKDRLKYIKGLEKAQLGGSIEDYLQTIYTAVKRSFSIYLKAVTNDSSFSQKDYSQLLKIGELSKATMENTSTLRYWTKIGLLDVVTTTASGYQLYAFSMVDRCNHIRKMQNQRYTLEEIMNSIDK